MPARTLGPDMPARIPMLFDLREAMFVTLITDALSCLIQSKDMVIGATGWSPSDPTVLVEVILAEKPLRQALIDYGLRIFLLSLLISIVTAALVYFSIQWLAVRPMRRLTANMITFQDAPQDAARIMRPGDRTDEVGIAERAQSVEGLVRQQQVMRSFDRLIAVVADANPWQQVNDLSHRCLREGLRPLRRRLCGAPSAPSQHF